MSVGCVDARDNTLGRALVNHNILDIAVENILHGDGAALVTPGREIEAGTFHINCVSEPGTPDWNDWLMTQMHDGDALAVDGEVLSEAMLQAFKEVYDAVVSYNSAVKNTSLKFDLQEASKQYVSLANLQYINGAIRYLDLLDANRVYLNAQVEYSSAVMDEYIAIVNIYKALGGGW